MSDCFLRPKFLIQPLDFQFLQCSGNYTSSPFTGHQDQPNPSSGRPLSGPSKTVAARAKESPFCYKDPQTPLQIKKKKKNKTKQNIRQFLEHFLGRFSLFSYLNSLLNTKIKTFDSSLFSVIKRQCSYILFPLLGIRTLDLRF